MKALLRFCRIVDALNDKLGLVANWLVLAACAISAGNALVRYGLNTSSNAWLEIQWYLFAGMVMLGAAHTLRVNGHVRVDVFYSRYGERARLWLDLAGGIVFLLPMTVMIGWLSWPMVANSEACCAGRSSSWCRSAFCSSPCRDCPRSSSAMRR
jgi:TRAP-type mannitol/chloroaromatic compound transport system permease small subunit